MILHNPVPGDILPAGADTHGRVVFRVTQTFGPKTDPKSLEPLVVWPGGEGIPKGIYKHFHLGLDLGNKGCGANVLAAAPGKVSVSDKDPNGANRIVIDHGDTDTRYLHMADRLVKEGQSVKQGQVIAHVGTTGLSTACHLHFAVTENGNPMDPWTRLAQNQTGDEVIPVEEDAAQVTTKPGAVYYDPATGAKVSVAVSETVRVSAYKSGPYRVVPVFRDSINETQLLGVKPNDPKVTVSTLQTPKKLAPGLYQVGG